MKCIALINQFMGYWEYNMKLVVVKSNFQILLVPNYRVFRITVIYVNSEPEIYPACRATREDAQTLICEKIPHLMGRI